MKYSVVIPTYNHCEDLLKPCLESIKKFSTLQDTEIIVVANGCVDGTKEYVESLGNPFKLIWIEQPNGYTKSANEGIRQATGEFVILLNNDTKLLDQRKDEWLETLIEPFKDPIVGVTGPMRTYCPHTKRDFIIFFCVAIRTKLFNELGFLDEIFSPGYGEDSDFCARAEDAGYSIKQVPRDSNTYYDDNRMSGDYPIWHEGNVTFKNWPGGEELLAKNNAILTERYGQYDIAKALTCDGFMSERELRWLAHQAKKSSIVIEVGSWHGRSSRAIADNLPDQGVLYCVDHWRGSEVERDTNHQSANWQQGDHAYLEFCRNLFDHIQSGKVKPIRLASQNAADLLYSQGIKADTVFLDAGHTYEEVKSDIKSWYKLVTNGGTLCGHDYYHKDNMWPGVSQAVNEYFGTVVQPPHTSLWTTIVTHKSNVYDCFIFNNEFDILEKRFETMYPVVDRFVVVEATRTHANKEKPLNFQEHLKRYEKYLDKVTYIVVNDYPATDSWSIERHQRDCIMRGLTECKDTDAIIISDCDEIPSQEAVKNYNVKDGIRSFDMELYYYNMETKAHDPWREAKVLPYSLLKQLTPCGARYTNAPIIPNGGQHLSYFGGVDAIIQKIDDTAHREYATDTFKDRIRIEAAIKNGTDVFGRDLKFEKK